MVPQAPFGSCIRDIWYAFYLSYQKFTLDLPFYIRKDYILFPFPRVRMFSNSHVAGNEELTSQWHMFSISCRGHSDQACAPSFEHDGSVNKTIPPKYSKHQHELPSLIS